MDDEIIHSWCFHDVECFDSTPSAVIIILEEDLESFSSLRSHQGDRVMRLHFTPVDPCSSRDGVTSVFASAASTCNELELSLVNIF